MNAGGGGGAGFGFRVATATIGFGVGLAVGVAVGAGVAVGCVVAAVVPATDALVAVAPAVAWSAEPVSQAAKMIAAKATGAVRRSDSLSLIASTACNRTLAHDLACGTLAGYAVAVAMRRQSNRPSVLSP